MSRGSTAAGVASSLKRVHRRVASSPGKSFRKGSHVRPDFGHVDGGRINALHAVPYRLEDVAGDTLSTEFDFQKQAALYIPAHLPDYRNPAYIGQASKKSRTYSRFPGDAHSFSSPATSKCRPATRY